MDRALHVGLPRGEHAVNVAIIGSGISGLVAAYRLHTSCRVTMFEANDYIGGHTNTVDVDLDGVRTPVDTGFIVFNDRTYPHFVNLLDELKIESKPTTMSFSVRNERTGLEYNGHSLNTLFAQRRNLFRPSFYRLVTDILRFNRIALNDDGEDEMTVGEFLARHRFSRSFAENYLLPMGAAIWSCPIGTFARFPIRFIVEFYRNHGLLSLTDRPTWRVVTGGSRTYVNAMTRPFRDRIRLRTPVTRVRRHTDRVEITTASSFPESFDHVIFACHSDQALRILGSNATPTERELLSSFPYERSTAILHTDRSLLPQSRRAWASWNYRVTGDDAAPATVTYNMNILQGIRSREPVCVTLNDDTRIDPARILGRFEYHHPIFTTTRAKAQARHREVLFENRTSFCGAYWRNGFHEDGVVSALAVVDVIRKPISQGVDRFVANRMPAPVDQSVTVTGIAS
jgi:predicted NAD/FAD-binding protein